MGATTMNLTQIEYFLAVAEKLNYTAAAQSLYVSQPALSRQISAMEAELQIKLLERDTKKVMLTKAGSQLNEDLKIIWQELNFALKKAKAIAAEEKDVIRIGVFDATAINDFWPPLYTKLRELESDLKIEVTRANFRSIRSSFLNNEFDIIFTLDFDFEDRHLYHSKRLYYRKYAFIYARTSEWGQKDKLEFADFENKNVFVVDDDGCVNRVLSELASVGIHSPKLHRVKDLLTVMTYLEMGQGYALLDKNLPNYFPTLSCLCADEYFSGTYVIGVWKNDTDAIHRWMNEIDLR